MYAVETSIGFIEPVAIIETYEADAATSEKNFSLPDNLLQVAVYTWASPMPR